MANRNKDDGSIIKRELKEFITSLGDTDVLKLCRNGSIWVKLQPSLESKVTQSEFYVLGFAHDLNTIQHGFTNNLGLLCNFNGLADAFYEDHSDSGDEMSHASPSLPKYNIEVGKTLLTDSIECSFESDFDSFIQRTTE